MGKLRLVLVIALALATIAVAVWWWQAPALAPTGPTITINNHTFSIEIADTPAKQVQGLSGRAHLEPNQGMYFPLNGRNASFWMKDMLIDIDIIWIDNGQVAGIDPSAAAPNPGTPDTDLTSYPSPVENPDGVLEIAAGRALELGIEAGDAVELSIPSE